MSPAFPQVTGPARRPGARRGGLARLLLAALMGLTGAALHAAPPPDAPPPVLAPHEPDFAQARQQADAAFAQAMQALQQRQWLEAELLLERALMFYPAHAEALLQLALLLAQRDRPESAEALIRILLDDPATPPAHRQQLQALLDNAKVQELAATAPLRPESPPHTIVGWSLGYSHNPLATTQAKELVLTLPQGNVSVPLERRHGQGATGQLQLYHRWPGGFELQAITQASNADNAHPGGRLTLLGPLVRSGVTPVYWSASSQQALDGSRRHTASLLWQPDAGGLGAAPVLYSLGLFGEPQSNRQGWTARAQKALPAGPALRGLAWTEYEHAQGPSPNALRLGWQGSWAMAPRWLLQGYGYAQADSAGYSPLLENNKSRRIFTGYLALERQLLPPIGGGQLALSLYWSQRWSNLPLFAWKDRGVLLQWQRQWR